jgi:hypothetical protein
MAKEAMTELTQAKTASQLKIGRTSVHYILNGYLNQGEPQ